jgi:preprotein translocase subunit SecG
MTTVLLIVHLFVTLALIGVVLIQRSEGGGLGVGSTQGMGSFMSGRGTANLLTRTTAILATAFMALSLALALLNRGTTVNGGHSILDLPPTPAIPAPAKPAPSPAAPATPSPAAPASTAAPATVPPAEPPPARPAPAPAITPAPSAPANSATPAPSNPTPGTQAPAAKP